jgi:hypothetical protein
MRGGERGGRPALAGHVFRMTASPDRLAARVGTAGFDAFGPAGAGTRRSRVSGAEAAKRPTLNPRPPLNPTLAACCSPSSWRRRPPSLRTRPARTALRSLARGEHAVWFDSLVLRVAPIYNADGNERVKLTNRPLQNGPAGGMGQRANAQVLDLNRDHMKLESPDLLADAKTYPILRGK